MEKQLRKNTYKLLISLTISIILLTNYLTAQTHQITKIDEPQIPIYIVLPYQEDSLKDTTQGFTPASEKSISKIIKKCDSLEVLIQNSTASNTVYFTWLYMLIALLSIMIIISLVSTINIKKELAHLKREEHIQKMISSSENIIRHIEDEPKETESKKGKPIKPHPTIRKKS